jgi:drug/metabolite transporter (DMT)-like permease
MTPAHDGARRSAGIAAALCAVTIWAGWLPVTRLAVITDLSPADVAALRYGTSALLLLPYVWIHRRAIPWSRRVALVTVTVGAGVPYFLVFAEGLRRANSGQGGVLGPGAVGVFTALVARAVLRERLRPARLAGLAITSLGIGIVVLHDLAAQGGRAGSFALLLVASLGWASFTVASRTLALAPALVTGFIAVANGVLYLPIYLACGGGTRLAHVPFGDIALQVLYQGVLTGVVALMAFTFAIGRLGAASAASFTPLSPVMIAMAGWLILGDTIDGATAAGLGAVALGVVVANRGAADVTSPR